VPLSQKTTRILGIVIVLAILAGAVWLILNQMQRTPQVVVVDPVKAPDAPNSQNRTLPQPGVPQPNAVTLSGSVVTPDGKPLANAEVLAATNNDIIDVYNTYAGSRQAASTRTDKDGKFSFPNPIAWVDLVVRADEGYACVNNSSIPADHRITIQPWGRVEGILRLSKNPQPNQQVTLHGSGVGGPVPTTNPNQPYIFRNPSYRVVNTQNKRTDENGRFVFERVAPGAGTLTKSLAMVLTDGRPTSMSQTLAALDIAPGQVVKLELGGTGRPVIGRYIFQPADEQLTVSGTVVPANKARVGFRPGPDWAKLSEEERTRIVNEWYRSMREDSIRINVAVAPDGTFRADDVPAGKHTLRLVSQAIDPTMGRIDNLAEGSTEITIAEMPGGRSDEPLDVGTVTVNVNPRVKIGAAAPALEATKADGSTVKLSDFRGKYVLLTLIQGYAFRENDPRSPLGWAGPLADRAGSDRVVKLAVVYNTAGLPKDAPQMPGWVVANRNADLDRAYTSSPGTYLIDAQGIVVGRIASYNSTAYGLLDKELGLMHRKAEGITVAIEKLNAVSASRAFPFQTIPTISKDDAGQQAKFTIIDGPRAGFASTERIFNDGLGPRHDRDESLMFTFNFGCVEGRIGADLGKAIEVEQINTYAWYKDSHRWAQVYRVYGADGSAPKFDAGPRIGTNPADVGWTFIAEVDTRTTAGGTELRDDDRGQSGVSIQKEGGAIGKFRYLLFEIFADETRNIYGQTFWAEIDIVGK